MFEVREFIDSCNNDEFYCLMGRFFAERIFRKELPYLINDNEKIWYLFFDKNNLVGFVGVVISQHGTSFTDFYLVTAYRNRANREYMAKYLFGLYRSEHIRVLTASLEEMAIWESLGFVANHKKGKYTSYVYEGSSCA